MHPSTARRVVVGVDGAPRTIAALRWAATEALRRDAELVAVHASGSLLPRASYAPVSDTDPAETTRRAAALLAAAVRTAFGEQTPVPVTQVVDDRPVVPALLGRAREAELLVMATRAPDLADGRPGELGPGSTTLSCLRMAPCPVVVLPTVGDRVWAAERRPADDERPPTLV